MTKNKAEILRQTSELLTAEKIKACLEKAAEILPGGRVIAAGRTRGGRPIYALHAGSAEQATCYAGGIHGQEGITSVILLKFLAELTDLTGRNEMIAGIAGDVYWSRAGLFLLPCLNMDGVARAEPGWQANDSGVDLNHNFDAGWELCKQAELAQGIIGPGPGRYGGKKPFSEPETRAVKRLCTRRRFLRMIAFHSQGEEIYGGHGGQTDPATEAIGELMAKLTGYTYCQPGESAAHGGMKDWFYDQFGRPAFTMEVGRGCNPLPLEEAGPIYETLRRMLQVVPLL